MDFVVQSVIPIYLGSYVSFISDETDSQKIVLSVETK